MSLESSVPPPIYSQQHPDEPPTRSEDTDPQPIVNTEGPQLLIVPTTDALNFQNGYLGADNGERAAMEGEVILKGAEPFSHWSKVTICFRTLETAKDQEVELALVELVLFDQSSVALESRTALPTSLPFAIPLMSDTPQSLATPHSSIRHTLVAKLLPAESFDLQPVSKTVVVHTKRYTSRYALPVSPETYSTDEPTRIEVEVPRTTFKAGEAIPIYLTIPPPSRELVVEEGLRLRNIKAELVRKIRLTHDDSETGDDVDGFVDGDAASPISREWYFPSQTTTTSDITGPSAGTSTRLSIPSTSSSSKGPKSPASPSSTYMTSQVIARSGASCRFHSTKPVQLRFILHTTHSHSSSSPPPTEESRRFTEADADCMITQNTLLHSVTFCLRLSTSFVDMTIHTEKFATITIPIIFIAPAAPLPEVDEAVDVAYQKKHDRRPARTTRQDEGEFSAPVYSEGQSTGEAGPSVHPPPFEDRGAPPPFSHPFFAASTSRLPTFLESETDLIPVNEEDDIYSRVEDSTIGEGVDFGFLAMQQFDGHSDDILPTSTPPPTLQMASLDTNLTPFIDTAEGPPTMTESGDPPPSIYSHYYPVEPPALANPPAYLPETTNVVFPPPYL